MNGFRRFLEQTESENSDLRRTLEKLPKSHRRLVQGYTWNFHGGNTLKGDKDHVGLLDSEKKTITVAAPWFHSRELTVLHEIAHLVWEQLVPEEKRKEWNELVRKTKMEPADRQSSEELFCMNYAAVYTKHTPLTYAYPKWVEFIHSLD